MCNTNHVLIYHCLSRMLLLSILSVYNRYNGKYSWPDVTMELGAAGRLAFAFHSIDFVSILGVVQHLQFLPAYPSI